MLLDDTGSGGSTQNPSIALERHQSGCVTHTHIQVHFIANRSLLAYMTAIWRLQNLCRNKANFMEVNTHDNFFWDRIGLFALAVFVVFNETWLDLINNAIQCDMSSQFYLTPPPHFSHTNRGNLAHFYRTFFFCLTFEHWTRFWFVGLIALYALLLCYPRNGCLHGIKWMNIVCETYNIPNDELIKSK